MRVLVADRHLAFAQIVAERLATVPDMAMVEVGSRSAVEDALRARPVDILVIDTGPDEAESTALLGRVRRRCPELRVVVLCEDEGERAVDALAAGATGLVDKGAGLEDLLTAIRSAARGETWISSTLLTRVVDDLLHGGRTRRHTELAQLTDREREVLECLVGGMSRAAIARDLFLSTHTVRTHTRNLLSKLQVRSTLEAVAMARRAGMRGHGPVDHRASGS